MDAVNKKLKILFVVDGYFPSMGGAERQAYLLSQALLKSGHDVKAITPHLDESEPVRQTLNGLEIERLTYPKIRLLGAMVLLFKFAFKLLAARNEYDAIHVHMVKNMAAVVGLLKPFLRSNVIAKVSGAWEFDGGVLDEKLSTRPINRLMNTFIRRLDYLQAISNYTVARLLKAGYPNSKIKMIPNAIDTRRFNAQYHSNHDDDITAVYTGRLRHVKGVDVLVNAWLMVVRKFPERKLRLLMAGEGDMLGYLQDFIANNQLEDNISLLGIVEDVPSMLDSAQIYVQPSRQEGLSNSVLEAMSVGLPVIATRISGNEDIITHDVNGILVEPDDAYGLAQKIIELISDPQKRHQLGARARQLVENTYEVDVVMHHLTQAYQGGL